MTDFVRHVREARAVLSDADEALREARDVDTSGRPDERIAAALELIRQAREVLAPAASP